jgi:hypothetical protein
MCLSYLRLAKILFDRASTILPYVNDSMDIDSSGFPRLMDARDTIDLDRDSN